MDLLTRVSLETQCDYKRQDDPAVAANLPLLIKYKYVWQGAKLYPELRTYRFVSS